jgi:hypothetical protein
MHRSFEASGFPLLHEVLAVKRVLAMRWSLFLRPSCNMTVPVPVLVPLLASLAQPTPESPVKTGFARRSPGHFFLVSPIRFPIPGLTRQVESRALLALAVFGFADELLRFEPLRRGLLAIFYFAAQQSLMCSSAANDIHNRLHLVRFERILRTLEPSPGSSIRLRPKSSALLFPYSFCPYPLFSYRHLPKARYLFVSSNTALRGLSFTASRRQSQELFFGSWIPSSTWFNFITAV